MKGRQTSQSKENRNINFSESGKDFSRGGHFHHEQLPEVKDWRMRRKQQPEPAQVTSRCWSYTSVSGYRHDRSHTAQDNDGRNPTVHGMVQEEPTAPADRETETSTEMVKNKSGLNV